MQLAGLSEDPRELLTIFARGANDDFQVRMNEPVSGQALAVFNRLAPSMDAQHLTEIFPGITALPQMKEVKGEIPYGMIGAYQNSITSRAYGLGFEIDYLQMLADRKNIGRLEELPARLANVAMFNRFYLLKDQLVGNAVWEVDGETLFSASHYFGDNDITVNVSSTSRMLEQDAQAIIDDVFRTQAGFVDHQGNHFTPSFDMGDLLFVVPPQHGPVFRRLQRQNLVARGASDASALAAIDNIDMSTFTLWTFPFLTANYIYVFFLEPTDGEGNPLGKTVPFARTDFDSYQMTVGGTAADPAFRNQRKIQTTIHGVEGLGIVDASRCIRVTLNAS